MTTKEFLSQAWQIDKLNTEIFAQIGNLSPLDSVGVIKKHLLQA